MKALEDLMVAFRIAFMQNLKRSKITQWLNIRQPIRQICLSQGKTDTPQRMLMAMVLPKQ